MERRAKCIPINKDITLIDDAGDSTCYLVTGEKRALLIDTVNGRENLKEIVAEITSLPLTVVNTHGHGDHILGNVYFDEVYLHPADWEMHNEDFASPEVVQALQKHNLKPCKLLPLAEDAVFDLGGLTLAAIPVPGHTRGSVALLCRKHRILFSGDALNSHLWMQLDESLPFAEFRQTLSHLEEHYRKEFDHLLSGHVKGLEDAAMVEWLLEGVDTLLAGQREKDYPYPWFMGTATAHPYGPGGQHCIVYDQSRL